MGCRPVAKSTRSASIASPLVVVTAIGDPLLRASETALVSSRRSTPPLRISSAEHLAQVAVEAAQRQVAAVELGDIREPSPCMMQANSQAM